ncbi:MAG: GntR family transcriptional regulator [Eubacterium sp.]|nr:GntR family transcriptional regulator [Eubacterium sp.]
MIQLNYRDSRPYYQQIMENIRQLIVSQVMKPDEKLPSVRDLAASLAINPNTIQRAYRELEIEGYVYSLSGKGTFVSPLPEGAMVRQRELLKTFEETAQELLYLKVPMAELKDKLVQIEEQQKPQMMIDKGGNAE